MKGETIQNMNYNQNCAWPWCTVYWCVSSVHNF